MKLRRCQSCGEWTAAHRTPTICPACLTLAGMDTLKVNEAAFLAATKALRPATIEFDGDLLA